MTTLRTPTVLTHAACVLSAVALGCSLWTACKAESTVPQSTSPAVNTAAVAQASTSPAKSDVSAAKPAGEMAATKAGTAPSGLVATTSRGPAVSKLPPVVTSPPAKASSADAEAVAEGLEVRRLVVTKKVVDREPEDADDFRADEGPVYAFVELANSADEEQSVMVTFEHPTTGAKVGHIKLSVPANVSRWRTWGHTRMIKQEGTWKAIVTGLDGTELAEQNFEVTG